MKHTGSCRALTKLLVRLTKTADRPGEWRPDTPFAPSSVWWPPHELCTLMFDSADGGDWDERDLVLGAMADLFEENGNTVMAYCMRWCRARKRWPSHDATADAGWQGPASFDTSVESTLPEHIYWSDQIGGDMVNVSYAFLRLGLALEEARRSLSLHPEEEAEYESD